MKSILRTILAPALALFMGGGAWGNPLLRAVDDDFALDPIGHLKKGLNLNYVYGDYNWKLLSRPSTDVNQYVPGNFIYPLARLADSYNAQDFIDIKELGFDHVRIAVDPWALGLLENPAGSGGPMFTIPTTGQGAGACAALRADILAARAANLMVIVDFHASNLAQGAWNNFYNSQRTHLPGSPPPVGPDDVPPAPYNYLGTQKWHFLTTTVNSAGQYPLEEFWASFFERLGSFDFPVAFELLNEPFDSAYDRSDAIWNLYGGPAGVSNDEPSIVPWINSRRLLWRSITLKCVKTFESPGRYFIVSPSTTGPDNYDEQWAAIKPFTNVAPDNIVAPQRLLYTVHFYTPFAFTQKFDAGVANGYTKERDYHPNSGSPYTDAPMTSRFAMVSQWIERSKSEWANAGIDLPLNMIFTEFGCVRSNLTRWPDNNLPTQPSLRGPGGQVTPPALPPTWPHIRLALL